MTDLEAHADHLIAYYRRLEEGGLDGQVVGVLTIEMSKGLLSGAVDPTNKPLTPSDVSEAAAAKRERRAAELAAMEAT